MFDIKWIRANADLFDVSLARRNLPPEAKNILAIDEKRREIVSDLNALQEKRNASSKQIGQAKAQKDEAKAQSLMTEVADLKSRVQAGEEAERQLTEELNAALAVLPNMLREDVPDGADETANVQRGEFMQPTKFNFAPKEHYELGEKSGDMNFEKATKMAGSRFVVLQGELARLERALGQFMLDLHTEEHGFTEVIAPALVKPEALFGTGQLPKFHEDAFETVDGRWLIPTSEVSLTNLVRESILSEEELPLRFTSLSPCFRAEAGSAGRDTAGMLRQHQFNKVEMVAITTPDKSDAEHERMLACAETVLKKLELPYRVMRLCAGDMGSTMARTFDIEAWLPGQDTYREISSVSIADEWQARRMNARYRTKDGDVAYVHTLNGSGIAVGRALIAVMENYQQVDGTIAIPTVLQPYMGGKTAIGQPS